MSDSNDLEPRDEPLDELVREYFGARLDGQLGRSAARFHRHLRQGVAPNRRGRGGWVVGVVGGAIAASIAALWAGPALRPPARPAAVPVSSAAQYRFDLDEVTLSRQTRDGGTVLLEGGIPARRIYRRELRQSRWVDPRNEVELEKIEPRQDVMLIEMDTY